MNVRGGTDGARENGVGAGRIDDGEVCRKRENKKSMIMWNEKKLDISDFKIEEVLRELQATGTVVLETEGAEETFHLGKCLGEAAAPGQVCTLIGDLGVGKTVFSQGLANGLGIEGPVNSPTFTIVQIYEEGRLPFYHFDVYRIADVEEMEEIGYEDAFYGEGVCLIEWANLIEEILPEHYMEITIEKEPARGFDYRRITLMNR